MKVLIACEESQEVCKAFRKLGHEAYSCDILECSGGHPKWHIQGDVLEQLNKDWDMIIGFPPCTHLAVSGARHFAQKIKDGRQQQGIDFFMALANAKCDKIALENPVSIMSSKWRKPDQIIQPYMFGHEAKKTTCLWLKGLPQLKPTKIVSEGEFYISPNGAKMPKWLSDPVDKNGKKIAYNSQEIKKLRSKTFPGVAQAMAEQWGTVGNFTQGATPSFNKDLEVSASPTPKESQKAIPSLNPDIMRNFSQEAKNLKSPETMEVRR